MRGTKEREEARFKIKENSSREVAATILLCPTGTRGSLLSSQESQ